MVQIRMSVPLFQSKRPCLSETFARMLAAFARLRFPDGSRALLADPRRVSPEPPFFP